MLLCGAHGACGMGPPASYDPPPRSDLPTLLGGGRTFGPNAGADGGALGGVVSPKPSLLRVGGGASPKSEARRLPPQVLCFDQRQAGSEWEEFSKETMAQADREDMEEAQKWRFEACKGGSAPLRRATPVEGREAAQGGCEDASSPEEDSFEVELPQTPSFLCVGDTLQSVPEDGESLISSRAMTPLRPAVPVLDCITSAGVEEASTQASRSSEVASDSDDGSYPEQPPISVAIAASAPGGQRGHARRSTHEPVYTVPGLPAWGGGAKDFEERELVKAFLAFHGFPGPRAGKRRMMRTNYPLHMAVRVNDPAMIALLLLWGADPLQADSIGRTPKELAMQKDSKGSHAEVVTALAGVLQGL